MTKEDTLLSMEVKKLSLLKKRWPVILYMYFIINLKVYILGKLRSDLMKVGPISQPQNYPLNYQKRILIKVIL